MNNKYKEADVRNVIKKGLKTYTDLARVRVKTRWKNMVLQERCAAARSLVFMEQVAKNPDAYFSRAATEEAWSKRAKEYAYKKGFKDFEFAYYIVDDPTGVVMKHASGTFFDGNNSDYNDFCFAVQQWMYDGHSDTYSAEIVKMAKHAEIALEYESTKCFMRPIVVMQQVFQR